MPNVNALTTAEARDLAALERKIEKGVRTFIEVGNALAEIKARKLYRERAETFQDYCQQVWGFDRTYAHRLIQAAQVEESLKNVAQGQHLPSERHARELAKVPEPERAEVWAEAMEKHGPDVTAAQLREEVEAWQAEAEEPEPASVIDGWQWTDSEESQEDDESEDDCPPHKPQEPSKLNDLKHLLDECCRTYGDVAVQAFLTDWFDARQ